MGSSSNAPRRTDARWQRVAALVRQAYEKVAPPALADSIWDVLRVPQSDGLVQAAFREPSTFEPLCNG
ncbi:MAG: hypothetical protein JWO04_3362 [Gammaproteobacteria bacterium]|nr:hypothetical protein [Gammaproteobacteria bacterium]